MKIIDEREMKTETKKKKQRQKAARGADAIVEASELNDFVVHLR